MDGATLVSFSVPAALCLIIGLSLIVLEAFLPGFGLPGITGMILLVAGIWLSSSSLLGALILTIVVIAIVGLILAIVLRSAAKGRLSQTPLILKSAIRSTSDEGEYDKLLGKRGVVHTTLRPAGITEIDGAKYNVVSDGEFIDAGQSVAVLSVEGGRIVVQKVY